MLLVTANLVTTNWTADAFGRVISELPPDGTEQRHYLNQCDATCPAWATHISITDHLKAGVRYAAPALAYLDDSGRTLRSQSWGLDGKAIVVEQRYDARARPIEADHPRFSDAPAILANRKTYDDLDRVWVDTVFSETGAARNTTTTYNGLTVSVRNPNSATRLKNGHTLVSSHDDKCVYEYDRAGKVVWKRSVEGNTFRSRRR